MGSIDDIVDCVRSERAVSPVIGIILMVAITVILAAVIGTFVLGIGSDVTSETPQATLAVISQHPQSFQSGQTYPSDGAQLFEIDHDGGDGLAAENLKIQIRYHSNNSLIDSWEQGSWTQGTTTDELNGGSALTTSDFIENGDRLTVWQNSANTYSSGTRYRIVFIDTETDQPIAEKKVRIR